MTSRTLVTIPSADESHPAFPSSSCTAARIHPSLIIATVKLSGRLDCATCTLPSTTSTKPAFNRLLAVAAIIKLKDARHHFKVQALCLALATTVSRRLCSTNRGQRSPNVILRGNARDHLAGEHRTATTALWITYMVSIVRETTTSRGTISPLPLPLCTLRRSSS